MLHLITKSAITLLDADKKEIVSWTPDKEYTSVIISAPSVKEGGQYTLTAGETTENITMDSLIYGNAQGTGQVPVDGQNDRRQGTPLRYEISESAANDLFDFCSAPLFFCHKVLTNERYLVI